MQGTDGRRGETGCIARSLAACTRSCLNHYLLGTEGCLPSALGARVRRSGAKLTVTDGPFTEAKRSRRRVCVAAATSKQEAIELAKQFLQIAGDGECELRQIYEQGENSCADSVARG